MGLDDVGDFSVILRLLNGQTGFDENSDMENLKSALTRGDQTESRVKKILEARSTLALYEDSVLQKSLESLAQATTMEATRP